jgi:hypothetical protein
MLRCKRAIVIVGLLLAFSAVLPWQNPPPKVSPERSTSLNGLSQQQVSGSVIWNSVLGATRSLLNLSNSAGPDCV